MNVCFGFDPATEGNKLDDSGLGYCGYSKNKGEVLGTFTYGLVKPVSKSQAGRISELNLFLRGKIYNNALFGGISLLQCGRDWWWKWTEDERMRRLTVLGYSYFSEDKKKQWIKRNKELYLLMEPLCKELTNMEVSENKLIWVGVVAKLIKEFKASVATNEALPDYLKHLILNANRNVADAVACVCMYYTGLLDEWINIKNNKGYEWYYKYFFESDKWNGENINGVKISKP